MLTNPKALAWATACAVLLPVLTAGSARAGPPLPEGFVHLGKVDASIAQDMRYAGVRNFTAAPVVGYESAECILITEAAQALARVQAALAPRGLGLKVYDCYRPMRAVRSFVAWVKSASARGDARYFPRTSRQRLIALGYIASESSHAKGTAVDITLVPLPSKTTETPAATTGDGDCTAPAARRERDDSLDMGTGYDCFDTLSHTRSPAIAPEQAAHRHILVNAMIAEGFESYANEWWHFTYVRARRATPAQDFPVTAP